MLLPGDSRRSRRNRADSSAASEFGGISESHGAPISAGAGVKLSGFDNRIGGVVEDRYDRTS
ncbi:hypothetical protein ACFVSU_08920 [Microbacterium sp. NPDC058062]|uniref:hypothetical protein n=1 Tax=Microbacterium sp. NPDC058062 TaxID=3346320 RepID=UPI0036DD30AB